MDKPVVTTAEVRDYLVPFQGKEISLNQLRVDMNLDKGSVSWNRIPNIMHQLEDAKVIRWVRRQEYRVVIPVKPVKVFIPDRESRPPFPLIFPRAYDSMLELDFANLITVREGDLITIGGVKSKGKTVLCLGFCAANIDSNPILMGNEYSIQLSQEEAEEKGIEYDIQPRLYERLKAMSSTEDGGWVDWANNQGDKFTLLPVWGDYAEHVVRDKINIIDWINVDAGKSYDIGRVLEGIKHNHGRGVSIAALQKGEGRGDPRGGQFVRDFSDVELLLDSFGDDINETLLTVKGVKEPRKGQRSPVGNTYAFYIGGNGTMILNFREVKKCVACHGQGFKSGQPCEECNTRKYVDK